VKPACHIQNGNLLVGHGNNPSIRLLPGDHLLYFTPCVADWVVCVKTWSPVAHIEVFDGEQMSLASRREGVNRYDFRADGLRLVRRPLQWDHIAARAYFDTVRGQSYDWLGLLCFTLAVAQGAPDKQFCSELARNLGRAAGSLAIDPAWPGDKTAPGSYLMIGGFETFWRNVA
jgi:hypothetical protein